MSEYTLYGTATCKYCKMATALLRKHGRTYKEVIIDDYPGLRGIIKAAGYSTVPIIFKGDTRFGGYEDLLETLEPETDNPTD